ncbi:MAG TPA: hypothetical protein VFR35_08475 [Actinoplanes sp.]|nr:hypothetical protein [Actinoplanes sp.]
MRGGLDDALDKLARRDELRRRTAGQATGTPAAVHELVEAIASVVGRYPKLEVTAGVEGVGDPTLLHFSVEDGVVQVDADSSVASRVKDATPAAPRHADFDIDLYEPIDEQPAAQHDSAYTTPPAQPPPRDDGQTQRISYDDRDRYDPGTGYGTTPYGEPDPYSRPEPSRGSAFPQDNAVPQDDPYRSPFAATSPPPVPPQQSSRLIRPEQRRAPEEPSADERSRAAASARTITDQRDMPKPLPDPVPLHVDSAETEEAAKRLAALVRDNPTLLRQSPQD